MISGRVDELKCRIIIMGGGGGVSSIILYGVDSLAKGHYNEIDNSYHESKLLYLKSV